MIEDLNEQMLDGVRLIPLKKLVNERGSLTEIQRSDDVHFLGFGQAYLTSTLPGVVKAWYRHATQHDQITLLCGALHLVLYDGREHCKTNNHLQHVYLDQQKPLLVQIPPGIWHGFQAVAAEPTLLLHLNSIAFDFAIPDEERLAIDDPRIPYCWDDHC